MSTLLIQILMYEKFVEHWTLVLMLLLMSSSLTEPGSDGAMRDLTPIRGSTTRGSECLRWNLTNILDIILIIIDTLILLVFKDFFNFSVCMEG